MRWERWVKGCILGGLMVAAAASLAPGATHASVPIDADYFGVNFQHGERLPPARRALHLSRIRDAGITQLRTNLSWRAIEREPPRGGVHRYDWSDPDARIAAAARHGLTTQPSIVQTPTWAEPSGILVNLQCADAASRKPQTIAPYIELARAIASRYGRGGAFWRKRPEVPARPIVRYEIWNEPNLFHTWCPRPQPERYADMFVGASAAIRSVDPGAEVIFGGVAPPNTRRLPFVSVRDFLRRAIARRPAIRRQASSIGIHVYPGTKASAIVRRVAWFRSELRAAGVPDSTPILVNEIGWHTRGTSPVSEPERTQAYTAATQSIPRSNCNVNGMLAHAWMTPESAPNDPESWWGIAHPVTAAPYPSGQAFLAGVHLMRGELSIAPPIATITACAGMPVPEPDGGGDTGGEDTEGGSGTPPRPNAAKCTRRLTNLRRRIRSNEGEERRVLRRKHRRVSRRCVPCVRRLATLRRKIRRSEGAERARYRARARQVRRRCRPCTRRLRRLEHRVVNSPDAQLRDRLMTRHQRTLRRCRPRRRG